MSIYEVGQRETGDRQHLSPSLGQVGADIYLPAVGPGGNGAVPGAEARTQGNHSLGIQGPWTRQTGRWNHRDASLPYKPWRGPGGFQATPTSSKGQLPTQCWGGPCWDWELVLVLVGGGGSWVRCAKQVCVTPRTPLCLGLASVLGFHVGASHPLRASHPDSSQQELCQCRPHMLLMGQSPWKHSAHVDLGCSEQGQLCRHVECYDSPGRGCCPGTLTLSRPLLGSRLPSSSPFAFSGVHMPQELARGRRLAEALWTFPSPFLSCLFPTERKATVRVGQESSLGHLVLTQWGRVVACSAHPLPCLLFGQLDTSQSHPGRGSSAEKMPLSHCLWESLQCVFLTSDGCG